MVLDRNDLIFTIETVLKAAGHVWRPEIEPPLPEVAADAVLLLISRKQPATPPASEPSRDAVIDKAERFLYANKVTFGGIGMSLFVEITEKMADFAIHFAGQRAEVAGDGELETLRLMDASAAIALDRIANEPKITWEEVRRIAKAANDERKAIQSAWLTGEAK